MNPRGSVLSIPTRDRVEKVEFCPYEWSCSLLLVAITNKIIIGTVNFNDEEADADESANFEVLREVHHSIRVDALAWSPKSSLVEVPKIIRFASADSDLKIRILSSDLCSSDESIIISGHCDYINDLAFEPNNGEQIASVSDDRTCRVWGSDGGSIACFSLTSPGMSVKWHRNDQSKLLVAEKEGIIRFYNLISNQPIMSLTCEATPLLNVDWSPSNSLRVGCIAGTNWYTWDISKSSLPFQNRQAHQGYGRFFRFSPSNHKMFATSGNHEKDLNVFHSKMKQVLLSRSSEPRIANFSWHYRLPILAVALDRKIDIVKIEIS